MSHPIRRSFPWGSLLGTLLALAGVFLLYTLVNRHEVGGLSFWATVGLIALGCFLVQPATMREIVVTVTPFIPVIGGRRAYDPPPPALVIEGNTVTPSAPPAEGKEEP
jgi:hypothetical protein